MMFNFIDDVLFLFQCGADETAFGNTDSPGIEEEIEEDIPEDFGY